MSRQPDRDFDPRIADWLEADPNHAPPDVMRTVGERHPLDPTAAGPAPAVEDPAHEPARSRWGHRHAARRPRRGCRHGALAKGLFSLLGLLGVDIPVGALHITTVTAVGSIAAGVLITLASGALPARSASRVAPIAALRDIAQDRSAVSMRRIVFGGTATLLAVATTIAGQDRANAKIVGIGAFALFLAVTTLGPVLARPLAATLGMPIAKFAAPPEPLQERTRCGTPSEPLARHHR